MPGRERDENVIGRTEPVSSSVAAVQPVEQETGTVKQPRRRRQNAFRRKGSVDPIDGPTSAHRVRTESKLEEDHGREKAESRDVTLPYPFPIPTVPQRVDEDVRIQ